MFPCSQNVVKTSDLIPMATIGEPFSIGCFRCNDGDGVDVGGGRGWQQAELGRVPPSRDNNFK